MGLYPLTDSGFLFFAKNLSTKITATPTAYFFTSGQATSLSGLVSTYETDFEAVQVPETRTKPALQAKDASKLALRNSVKYFVSSVRANLAVTNEQLAELLLPPRTARVPEPVPDESPVLTVLKVEGWGVQIRAKSSNPARRGRPPLTTGTTIVSYVGATPPADVSGWKFEGNTGKSVVQVNFDTSLPAGTKVWLSAFFFNGSKQSGPACTPVSTILQGGGLVIGAADADHDNLLDAPAAKAA